MAASGLLVAMHDAAPELEADFDLWYREEQFPRMLAVPGVLSAQWYRATAGEPRYLALYDLADPKVLGQSEYTPPVAEVSGAVPLGRRIHQGCTNLVEALYEHLLTLPAPEPTDLARARALMLMGLEVESQHEEEFRDWYATEHLPALSGTPGVIRARRYRLVAELSAQDRRPTRYLALYDLERREVVGGEEWARRAGTPWTSRMRRLWTTRRRIDYDRVLSNTR